MYNPPLESFETPQEYARAKEAYDRGYQDASEKKPFKYPGADSNYYYYAGFDDFEPFNAELIDKPGN